MNFLTFRDQIYNWTLDNDQNLFNQVNQLTDYIFQTEQNINQSIAITRSAFNQSSTILNNNYNHYLRLSENKFTQNKIAEPKKHIDQNKEKQQIVAQPKTKMDIFKQSLNISLKNLQIKEQDKEADNVSLSQLSLSQAIFKNARLPPYFGSKQFRAQKFLNLFFDQDLGSQILSKKQIQSLSNQPLSTPSQNGNIGISNNPIPNNSNGYLPPPPSLESLNLGQNNYMNPSPTGSLLPPPLPSTLNLPPPPSLSGGTLPSPPSLPPNLLPPPPIIPSPSAPLIPTITPTRQSVIIDEQDQNKQLLESILASTRTNHNNGDSQIENNESSQNQIEPQAPKPVQNKPLTFQQQLALKLKYGKDYKPPIKVVQSKPQPVPQKKQPQQSLQRANSFRQSTKIQDIIGVTSSGLGKAKPKQSKTTNSFFNDQDQQEQNALFGSGKRKTVSQNQLNQASKTTTAKNQADIMMSRSTFNEDMLFKKKPVFSKQTVIPTKTQQKPVEKQQKRPNRASVLFNQDSDQQQDNFTFKKKTVSKKEQKPVQQSPKKQQQKKSNPLGLTEKQQVKSKPVQQVKSKPVQQPKKKNINKLFGGQSDQEQDMFTKKKPMAKKQSDTPAQKQQIQTKKVQQKVIEKPVEKKVDPPKATKKNSLFNDQQQEQDFSFKPKPKAPAKTETKKQPQQKKSALFGNDDEQQDFSFSSKNKVTKKESEKQVKQQQIKTQKTESPQKLKNPLISKIVEQQNEQQPIIPVKKQAQKVEAQVQKVVQQEQSQQSKRLKKIARMGGQPMMGMAQLIPKGMQITKPSQTKNNQKLAMQNLQHQNKNEQKQQPKVQIQVEQKTKSIQPIQQISQPIKEPIKVEQQKPVIIQKAKQQNVQSQTKQVPQSTNVNLQVRRKKNKPKQRSQNLFDDDDQGTDKVQTKKEKVQKVIPPKVVQVQNPKQQKAPQTVKQQKTNNPLFNNDNQNEQKSSQISKIAKMSMAGGMPGMGMGPLMMPKGLVITKPSQAKKLQKQALQKAQKQQQQKLKRKQQEQKLKLIRQQQQRLQKQKQEQQNSRLQQQQRQLKQAQRKKQQQYERQRKQRQRLEEIEKQKYMQQVEKQKYLQQVERQKLIQIQNQRKRQELQQQRLRQQETQRKRKQFQQQERQRERMIQMEKQRLRLKNLQEMERQRKLLEQEQRRKQQEQLKKQKSNLPSLPNFDISPKKQSNPLGSNPLGGKTKASGPLDVPKLPPKGNPLGGPSKSPLGGLTSNSQKSTGLLSNTSNPLPPMPVISKQPPKNTGKKSLFDDDQQDSGFSKKKQTNIPKPSISSNNQKKKPSLFGDDEQDSGFSFGSKAKPKKNTTSKKGLFDDDDDDEGFGFGKKNKKQQIKQPQIQTSIIQTKHQQVKLKTNNLNKDSDEEDTIFTKKMDQPKQQAKMSFASNKIQEQTNVIPSSKNQPQKITAKKGLFADSDEDEGFGKKKVQKKPIQNTGLVSTNTVTETKKAPQKQVKSKKGLFGSSDQDQGPIKLSKPTVVKQTPPPAKIQQNKPKKGLFGGSDDQDDDMFNKKAQKKTEPTKSTTNTMKSQPFIPTKNNETNSLNNLIPPKKSQSLSPSPLSTNSKPINPLGGLSGNLSQPKVQNTPQQQNQQKKRNIFEESDEQDSSPIIASKTKVVPQVVQKNQKKGIISQESQQQKPVKKQQPIKIVPVRQQQSQPQPVPAQSNNNNRRLFDDSQDSDQEQMMKKKRMANNKLKKLF